MTLVVLVLMVLVALFSVQNAGVITVRFVTWHFEMSEALVILLSAFCGALAGLLIGAFSGARKPAEPKRTADPAPPDSP